MSMGNPKDEVVKTVIIEGCEIDIYGLYTLGEGNEQPGDDGYDAWWTNPGEGDAVLLNAGEELQEIPSDEALRAMLVDEGVLQR